MSRNRTLAGSGAAALCVWLLAAPAGEANVANDAVDAPTLVLAEESATARRGDDRWSSKRRGGHGRPHLWPEELEDTIWFSEEPHRRVTVDLHGNVDIKEGKDLYVHIKERIDDIFVIEIRWWNEAANINVLEHGILTHIEDNQYHYSEADHLDSECEQEEFPGVIGRGVFELFAEDRAKLIQIGHLIDGSASGFTTYVEQVDTPPEAPIEQTYPIPCS